MRRILLLAMALLLAPLASAQVYRWVDGNGTVHFSQTPPPAGVKYQIMHLSSDTGTVAGVAPAPAGGVAPGGNGAGAPAQPPPMANTPANRTELCKQLQQNLTLLNSSEALNVAGPDGKPKALEGKAREVQKATTQAQIKQYCSASATQAQ